MKSLFTFLAILLINLSFAQDYKVIYEMKFKPTKGKDSIVSEHFVLMIKPKTNSSKFYNYNYYYSDSLMTSIKDKNPQGGFDINTASFKKANYPLGVIKTKTDFYLVKTLDGDSYKINETKPSWKISNETKSWKDYKLQKATAKILGRNWTVWYSNEIPVSDGPYLFKDLPGLVFLANDDSGDYDFSLISLQKSDLVEDYFPSILSKSIEITSDKYKKVYKAYTLDPAKQLRNGVYVDDSGLKINLTNGASPEMIRAIEKDRLDNIKKFNNFIDIE
ncbi:GLPGLI family protein [Epilithonimonas hispanica]|uniref:GLPGLI family protein n=1 Tax=Epilithonimonas hispanica TaxID=358687 RepID=A0A3D9CJ04_9FLAO|nr:GLPGLI family protein [Epilithonimonas hispanica]REC65650.1 GLPGLI family protein [Epilithonimonas hispanica]